MILTIDFSISISCFIEKMRLKPLAGDIFSSLGLIDSSEKSDPT